MCECAICVSVLYVWACYMCEYVIGVSVLYV